MVVDTAVVGDVVPPNALRRERLLDRLDGAVERPVTLVTAPPGYGKSVLVAQWCHERCPLPVTWVAADATTTPLRSLLAAALDGAGNGPVDDAFASSRAGVGDRVVVIDDERFRDPDALVAQLATAIATEGSGVHVIAVGRSLPHGSVAPLILQGVVDHIDGLDLRLDATEVAQLMEEACGRELPADVIASVTEKLDGWMAGVAAVAKAVGQDADVASLGARIAAGFELVHAYQTSEVIARMPDELRTFALATACLDTLEGGLCDAATGMQDGHAKLHALRTRGFPISPAEGQDGWFRYHAPFRSALERQADLEDPDIRTIGLKRAAAWLAGEGSLVPAARCYVYLREWDGLSTFLLDNVRSIVATPPVGLPELLEAVPIEFHRTHFPLAIGQAFLDVFVGRVTAALETLALIEPHATVAGRMTVESLRASTMSWVEDVDACLAAAERAIELCDEIGEDYEFVDLYNKSRTDHYRAMARGSALLAGAYAGRWHRVEPHHVDIAPDTAMELNATALVWTRGRRATYLALSGDAAGGRAEAEAALAVAERGSLDPNVCADAHYALGECLRAAALPQDAVPELERALELARTNDRRNLVAAAIASLTHAYVDTGAPERVLETVRTHEAEIAHRNPPTIEGLMVAARARVHAALGEPETATRTLRDAPRTSAVASVQVAVALSSRDHAKARDTIAEWPDEPTVGSRVRQALSHAALLEARRQKDESLRRSGRALRLAARHQLVQPLVELGEPIVAVLRRTDTQTMGPRVSDIATRARAVAIASAAGGALTTSETAVIRRLRTQATLSDIARELSVSINTLKSHTRSIYRKLGVNSRAEAIDVWDVVSRTRET